MIIIKHSLNIKKMWKFKIFKPVIVSVVFILLMSCNGKQKKVEDSKVAEAYTCPMHPQIVKDKPGACPICGMDLVLLHNNLHLKMEIDASLADLIEPVNESIISNIKTIKISSSSYTDTLHLNGLVTYNTNNLKTISSRLSGRIEKLYVKYNYESVSKGQKIMDIYSPDLAAAQQELLYLKNSGDVSLMNQAKTKLRLLGVTETQMNDVLKSGKVNYKFAVYSPFSGYIIDSPTANSTSNQANSGNKMGQTSISSTIINTPINIVEGQYINIGDLLLKIFNPKDVWAEFYSNDDEVKQINKDNPIQIIKNNEEKINAKIDLVQPYFNEGQNYSVIRTYLNNSGDNYKIGELLKAKIIKPEISGLWVPTKAVYQLGEKNIVFIKNGQVLIPKEVRISEKANQQFLIKTGLKEGEEIAINASYLIDTESFIKTN